jgi:hypothetical protein
MDGQGNIAALIGAAVTARTADRGALLRLSAACWPGRDDRTVPVARRWIESWGPRPMAVEPHVCSGLCASCN